MNNSQTAHATTHMKKVSKTLVSVFKRQSFWHLFWAMFTQGILSVASFVVGFVVARFADKSEYGLYVLLFSIIGIFGNYQNAIVNTPMTVLLRKRDKNESSKFISGFAVGQWLIIIPSTAILIFAGAVWSYFHHDMFVLKMMVILCSGVVAYSWREFLRTVSYSVLKIGLIVRMDLVFVFVILVSLGIMVLSNKVTGNLAIEILAAGYLISAIVGHIGISEHSRVGWKTIRSVAVEAWKCSKWAIIGVTSGLFQNRGYLYVITGTLGLETVGDVSAARLLMMPVGFLVLSSGKISLAKGVEVLDKAGVEKLRKFSILLGSALALGCIVYGLVLFLFFNPIIALLGDKYQNVGGYAVIWAIFFTANSLRFPISNSLLACREFKWISIFDVITGISTITSCIVLTKCWGGYGAIGAVAVGEIILCVLTARLLFFTDGGKATDNGNAKRT